MSKILLTIALIGFSLPVFAAKNCLQLLTFEEPSTAFNNSERSAATLWLQSLAGGNTPVGFQDYLEHQGVNPWNLTATQREDWLARFALGQWEQWREVNEAQRDHALALELRKISPAREGNTFRMDGDSQITRLSQANLKRMLSALRAMHPISPAVAQNKAIVDRVQELARNTNFHYLRSYRVKKETGIYGPIPSQLELQRLGLHDPLDFYSALVDQSPSVGFNLTVTSNSADLYNLGAQVVSTSIRANSELATDAGFSLPRVDNALELMHLFSVWQPEALDELLRDLRFSLPNQISTLADLNLYLTSGRLDIVFPESSLYQRMASLRTRLYQFALTERDTQEFVRQALAQFLLSEASRDRDSYNRFIAKMTSAGGAQKVVEIDLMNFLGFKGISMRIPLAVSDYSIVRREALPPATLKHMSQKPWDARRLDHPTAP